MLVVGIHVCFFGNRYSLFTRFLLTTSQVKKLRDYPALNFWFAVLQNNSLKKTKGWSLGHVYRNEHRDCQIWICMLNISVIICLYKSSDSIRFKIQAIRGECKPCLETQLGKKQGAHIEGLNEQLQKKTNLQSWCFFVCSQILMIMEWSLPQEGVFFFQN